jgi:hypothetical protein
MATLAGRGPVPRCQPIVLARTPPAKIAERRGMLVAQMQRDLGRVFDVVIRESPERHTRMFLDPPDGPNSRPTPRALVDTPEASVIVLTDTGAAFIASHPRPVDSETLRRDCPPYLNWLADMGAVPATERHDRGEPTVWMVRAGEGGVHAPVFVQQGAVFLGWGAAGDMSGLSLDAVSGRVADAWPQYGRRQCGQAANALYKFAIDMQPGDIVVTPEPASRARPVTAARLLARASSWQAPRRP